MCQEGTPSAPLTQALSPIELIIMTTEEYLQKLFTKSGWYEGRSILLEDLQERDCLSHENAINILKEFGGLSVGETAPGRECAASNIDFYLRPWYEAYRICERWEASAGKLTAIASAHHQHILLMVNTKNDLYIYTEPDEKMYFGGSFQKATSKLLLGLDYGSPINMA